MKKTSLFLSILIMVTACAQKEKKTVIGLAVSTLNNPFFVELRDGAVKQASQLGYDVVVLDAQNDVAKELSNIEDLVSRKVAVLMINPVDSDSSSRSAQLAINANIPVISLDRVINGVEVTTHIASDNVQGGKMAGEYIASVIPNGSKVIELEGIPGTSAARDRGNGFNEAAAAVGLNIVAKQPADFDRARGLTVTEGLLQANSDVAAIFAHNDEMALGALKAAESAKKKIIIVGFDATPDAVAAVKEGKLAATVAQKPDQIGVLGVDQAAKIINGTPVDSIIPVDLTLISQ